MQKDKRFRFFFLMICATTLASQSSHAQLSSEHPLGLGFTVGSPSGVTVKYWINEKNALDTNLGWGWGNKIVVWSDYLWLFPEGFGNGNHFMKMLLPYLGGGLLLGTSDKHYTHDKNSEGHGIEHTHFGFRLPLGVDWKIPDVSITLGVEIAPTLLVAVHTRAGVQFGISGRYYF